MLNSFLYFFYLLILILLSFLLFLLVSCRVENKISFLINLTSYNCILLVLFHQLLGLFCSDIENNERLFGSPVSRLRHSSTFEMNILLKILVKLFVSLNILFFCELFWIWVPSCYKNVVFLIVFSHIFIDLFIDLTDFDICV